MTDEEAIDLDLLARLAAHERMARAEKTMSAQEKGELEEWVEKHVSKEGRLYKSDWPGWHAIVARTCH